MFQVIKKSLPEPLKKLLINAKLKTYDQWQKKRLFKRMQSKHAALLKNIKGKEKIKVVFLAIHKSVWKVDPVFKKMLDDPFFEPLILVCPYSSLDDEHMLHDMEETYEYFEKKGYPVVSAHLKKEKRWLGLDELKPDIVFFTNPHDLTYELYYEKAYLNYLSCYIPYAHDVSKYDGYIAQYNQSFHNAMWKIFAPHEDDLNIFKKFSQNKAKNVHITGYPACESFFKESNINSWKSQNRRKVRIIWAPHHTIEAKNLALSNFLRLYDFFKHLAEKYSERIQISFKPHPILKSKLYKHSSWGKIKTDEYYKFWEVSSNTQIDLGDYYDLFKQSDALIHDSGSFLAEYHYVRKPVFFICDKSVLKFLNPFGLKALKSCEVGLTEKKIENFIISVLENKIKYNDTFFETELKPFFSENQPSDRVIEILKLSLLRN